MNQPVATMGAGLLAASSYGAKATYMVLGAAVGKVFWSTSRGTPAGVVHSSSMARGTSHKPKLTSGVHLHRPTYPATPCSTWAVLILRHGIFDSAIGFDQPTKPGGSHTSHGWLLRHVVRLARE